MLLIYVNAADVHFLSYCTLTSLLRLSTVHQASSTDRPEEQWVRWVMFLIDLVKAEFCWNLLVSFGKDSVTFSCQSFCPRLPDCNGFMFFFGVPFRSWVPLGNTQWRITSPVQSPALPGPRPAPDSWTPTMSKCNLVIYLKMGFLFFRHLLPAFLWREFCARVSSCLFIGNINIPVIQTWKTCLLCWL